VDIEFIDKEKISALLPMNDCIEVMEEMFRSMARGDITQPLRSLMQLPDKKGLLGMMPAFVTNLGVMGIKIISVFHANRDIGYPSHQGLVILFDSNNGTPLMMFDAFEITAIRTAAASAVATKLLSTENSETLAIIGSGEQAERHIEAILLVRNIKGVRIWSRNEDHAKELCEKASSRYDISFVASKTAKEAKERRYNLYSHFITTTRYQL